MTCIYEVILYLLQDRVIGILDWELSTLGNQMCDVAYSSLVLTNVQILVLGMETAIHCSLYLIFLCL